MGFNSGFKVLRTYKSFPVHGMYNEKTSQGRQMNKLSRKYKSVLGYTIMSYILYVSNDVCTLQNKKANN